MSVDQKKSIYLTKDLKKIYDECKSGEYNRTFSGRMADIAERYNALIGLAEIPEITEEEKMILGEVVLSTYVDKNKIKYMDEYVLDTELPGCKELAKKIKQIDFLQRVALIESLNI